MLAFAMNDPNLRRRLICMITQQMIHFYRHFGWNSVAQYLWINRFARAKPIYDQQRTQPDDTLSARVVRYLFQNIHRINFSIFQLEEWWVYFFKPKQIKLFDFVNLESLLLKIVILSHVIGECSLIN